MSESTIKLDENSRTFYQGVAAGAKAIKMLGEGPAVKYEARIQYFWLSVGTDLAQAVPDGDPERVALFIQGAATHKPNADE